MNSIPTPSPLTQSQNLWLGAVLLLIGLGVACVALGWIPSPAEKFGAPRDVLLCAGLVFAFAGALLAGGTRTPVWLAGLFAACIWTLFAIIPSWIAWGAGPREFSGDGMWLFALLGLDNMSIGGIVFGFSAVIMWAITAVVWYQWLLSFSARARVPVVMVLAAVAAWIFWGRGLEPSAVAGETEQERLAHYIALKHADFDFEAGESNPLLQPRAETWIKRSRDRLAALRRAPANARVQTIPMSNSAPVIDGKIESLEWAGALRVAMVPGVRHASARLLVHGGKLYVAAEAPRDWSADGFDQFRIYFHMELAPGFQHERIHVSRGRGVSSLRSVQLAAKKFPASEHNVLGKIRSASTINNHRQFELEMDLAEAGLNSGAPFPVVLEIEGDPLRDQSGRFKARLTEGQAGTFESPIWVQVLQR